MGELRDRLRSAIAVIGEFGRGHFGLNLRPPATEEQLLDVEAEFGMRLPDDLRELYLLHDGQDQLVAPARLFSSEFFAPLAAARNAWRAQVFLHGLAPGHDDIPGFEDPDGDPELRQVPADIRWFPFAVDSREFKTALFVDLNPPSHRPSGQVILQGPWAAPPHYVGASVVEVLETYARHIRSRGIGIMPVFPPRWGFGPTGLPLEYVTRALDPPQSPRYGVDVSRPLPNTVWAIGDLRDLHTVALRGATDLDGIEGGPINTLALYDSAQVDLSAAVATSIATLSLRNSTAAPGPDLPSVGTLIAGSIADLETIDRLPSVRGVVVDLGDEDPNSFDWRRASGVKSLTCRGGRISSLAFITPLADDVNVAFLAPSSISVSGLPASSRIGLEVIDAPLPPDLDELGSLALPARVSGPREWADALDGRMAQGVWTEVFERGDRSTWLERSSANWAMRAAALESLGLPPY